MDRDKYTELAEQLEENTLQLSALAVLNDSLIGTLISGEQAKRTPEAQYFIYQQILKIADSLNSIQEQLRTATA